MYINMITLEIYMSVKLSKFEKIKRKKFELILIIFMKPVQF